MWVSITGAVLLVLNATGAITLAQSEAINIVVNALLGALAAFGIVNDPTNPTGF
jgi:uncharacterized membrane protein